MQTSQLQNHKTVATKRLFKLWCDTCNVGEHSFHNISGGEMPVCVDMFVSVLSLLFAQHLRNNTMSFFGRPGFEISF